MAEHRKGFYLKISLLCKTAGFTGNRGYSPGGGLCRLANITTRQRRLGLKDLPRILLISSLIFFWLLSGLAMAWPIAGQWIPIYKGGALLQDPSGDASGARNVVSDLTHDAAFIFNDGTYIYFRLRLDQDPSGQGGQGALQSFGWGIEIDTNNDPGNYEWLFMVDGISRSEVVTLWQNTAQGRLGDASDKPEILQASVPLSGNYQVSPADTAINGETDYFLDWRFPAATFKQISGLSDSTPLRLFWGSSSSTNNLTSSGADLVGGSDLYSGLTDTITLLGTTPTTGTVRFVANLAGGGDVIQILPGDSIYIRVDDKDLDYDNATLQTLQVTLSATSGDTVTVALTETQSDSGIFTASIPSQSGAAVTGDAILQVTPGATVGVEYVDRLDASLNANLLRTDSLWVVLLTPAISLVKSVDQATAPPGTAILYTVYYRNSGLGAASNLIISDTIPLFTTYVVGSLKIGTTASTYATATALTDTADGDAGQVNGGSVIFTIPSVAGDDGVANSGSDEGKVYFKVRIN